MSRPPQVPDRDSIDGAELAAYDRTVQRVSSYSEDRRFGAPPGGIQPYYGALLQSPELADCISEIGAIVTRQADGPGGYSAADREWADLVAAVELSWNRAFYSHAREAVRAGVRPEAIKALREGRDRDLNKFEQRLGRYIRRVLAGSVSDRDYEWIEERFGERGAVEFTAFIGFLMLNFRVMQALGIADRSSADVDALIEELVQA